MDNYNSGLTAPPGRIPALYLGHGAPPLLEEAAWMEQFKTWTDALPRPTEILIVSAHWESAPVTVSATTPVPLVYDFYGFPEHYYRMRYDAPGAPELAQKVVSLMPDAEPVMQMPNRGLDHGAGFRSRPCTPMPTSRSCRCRCRTSTRAISSRSASGWRRCATRGC